MSRVDAQHLRRSARPRHPLFSLFRRLKRRTHIRLLLQIPIRRRGHPHIYPPPPVLPTRSNSPSRNTRNILTHIIEAEGKNWINVHPH